jgi:hypothetical protein
MLNYDLFLFTSFKEILLVAKRIGTYIMEDFSIGSLIQIPVLRGAW